MRQQIQNLQNQHLLTLREMALKIARSQVEVKGQIGIEFLVAFNVTQEGHEDVELAAALTLNLVTFSNLADVASPQSLRQVERGQNKICSDFAPMAVRFCEEQGDGAYNFDMSTQLRFEAALCFIYHGQKGMERWLGLGIIASNLRHIAQ